MKEDIKIYAKIAIVQKEIGVITKDAMNTHYKHSYFDINTLIEKLNPILEKQKLMLTQPIINNCVCSIITDIETGTQLQSDIALPTFDNPQKTGSAITYYRRYSLQSLLAIEAEDDDANMASLSEQNEEDNKPWINEVDNTTKTLTKAWNNVIEGIKKGTVTSVADVRKRYKVNKTLATKIEGLIQNNISQ